MKAFDLSPSWLDTPPPRRNFAGFALLLLLCYFVTDVAAQQENARDHLTDEEALAIGESAKKAIAQVRASGQGKVATRTGVIITAQGHVVIGWPAAVLQLARQGNLTVRLPDGEERKANLIAESQEYRVALLQISGQPKGLHSLQIGTAKHGKTGDAVLQIGYQRGKLEWSKGTVNRTVGGVWGTSTLPTWSFGGAIVDRNGRLVGLVTHQCAPFLADVKPNPNGKREAVHTRSSLLTREWSKWLSPRVEPVKRDSANAPRLLATAKEQTKASGEAIAQARKASIRIRRMGSDPHGGSSGVIVSKDGYIITCGHHFMLAGDKVTVTFADGKESPGRILGTNWVTDICIAKLDGEGPWPFSPMASSKEIKVGAACFTMGFATRGRRPDLTLKPREFTTQDSKVVQTSSTRITSRGRRIPGESGGGIFDLNGQVLGIGEGWGQQQSTDHLRVELFVRQWSFLTNQSREQEKPSGDSAKTQR